MERTAWHRLLNKNKTQEQSNSVWYCSVVFPQAVPPVVRTDAVSMCPTRRWTAEVSGKTETHHLPLDLTICLSINIPDTVLPQFINPKMSILNQNGSLRRGPKCTFNSTAHGEWNNIHQTKKHSTRYRLMD